MDEEQKKAYQEKQERIKKLQQDQFLKREQYNQKLKETTLQSFKDRPEEVKNIRCMNSEAYRISIEWDPPFDNNSPIIKYHIYLSSKKVNTKIQL